VTRRSAVIVAGPTCSGKSRLAIALAERLGGIVINADAMQLYRELRVLTARPSDSDEAQVPHALYGVRPAREPATAAWWRTAALDIIAATRRVPILCGGTGLYLHALRHGLAEIPDPGAAARSEARTLLATLGATALHARLAQVDPVTAARLRPTDGQRLSRAWEVWRGTGRSLASWQADAVATPAPLEMRAIVLNPDRAALRAAIATRWTAMLAAGAAEEVQVLRAQGLDPALPVMRAHGVPELSAWLDGSITLAEADRRAVLAIGQYTKRQATWLKHHSLTEINQSFTIDALWTADTQLLAQNMPGMMDFLSPRD
jgi:tRNA dimethylallyltransferase